MTYNDTLRCRALPSCQSNEASYSEGNCIAAGVGKVWGTNSSLFTPNPHLSAELNATFVKEAPLDWAFGGKESCMASALPLTREV